MDPIVKQNEIMKQALEDIIKHQEIILKSSTGWAVSMAETIAKQALKKCEELEK